MTWETILAIAGGVVLLGNAGAMIYKWIRPALKVKEDVAELEKRTKNDYEAIKSLEQTILKVEKTNKMYLRTVLNVMNHMIDGNGVEEMKKTRSEIEDLLAGVED